MSDRSQRKINHGSYHPSLSHAAERRAVGDARSLLRRRCPVALGWPRKTNLRAAIEAILYVLRAGWRMLPSDFPP
ncbi:MAG: hypothetical protein BRC58_02815 [Cyanobacteria bacterium QS_8_64_29]|nr:MAG: hypothetical protein BRC58_02815 [Cyanobacteria bacterium QS_8_64_29]